MKGNRGTCAPAPCTLRWMPLTRKHVTGRTFCFLVWLRPVWAGGLAALCLDETLFCFPPWSGRSGVSLRLLAPPLLSCLCPLRPLAPRFSLPGPRFGLVALADSLTVVFLPPPPGWPGPLGLVGLSLTSGVYRGPLGSPFRLGLCVPDRFPGFAALGRPHSVPLPFPGHSPRPCCDPALGTPCTSRLRKLTVV